MDKVGFFASVIVTYFHYAKGCVLGHYLKVNLPELLAAKASYLGPKSTTVDVIMPLAEYYRTLVPDEQREFRLAYASLVNQLTCADSGVLLFLSEVYCPEAGTAVGRLLAQALLTRAEPDQLLDLVRAAGDTRSKDALPSLRSLVGHLSEYEEIADESVFALAKVDYHELLPYLPDYLRWLKEPGKVLGDPKTLYQKIVPYRALKLSFVLAECAWQGGPVAMQELWDTVRELPRELQSLLLVQLRQVDQWPDQAGRTLWFKLPTASRGALRSLAVEIEDGGGDYDLG